MGSALHYRHRRLGDIILGLGVHLAPSQVEARDPREP